MKKLYIAGPMTGLPELNYPAFHEAETRLQAVGYDTLNPARNQPPGEPSWLAFMRMSLVQIAQADGLALLPDWETSKGARIEHDLSISIGLDVKPLNHWLDIEVATKQYKNTTRASRHDI